MVLFFIAFSDVYGHSQKAAVQTEDMLAEARGRQPTQSYTIGSAVLDGVFAFVALQV